MTAVDRVDTIVKALPAIGAVEAPDPMADQLDAVTYDLHGIQNVPPPEYLIDGVVTLVDRAEWKRRQSAPGPKISRMAFGRDRRLPITSRWREHGS